MSWVEEAALGKLEHKHVIEEAAATGYAYTVKYSVLRLKELSGEPQKVNPITATVPGLIPTSAETVKSSL